MSYSVEKPREDADDYGAWYADAAGGLLAKEGGADAASAALTSMAWSLATIASSLNAHGGQFADPLITTLREAVIGNVTNEHELGKLARSILEVAR